MRVGSSRALPRIAPLVAFPALWLFCVGLAQIHVVAIQQPWSKTMWIVALVVPVAFVLGGLVAQAAIGRPAAVTSGGSKVAPAARHRLRAPLLACAILGNLEETHQFVAGRTVPLFSAHIDAARFALPGGPTIVLTDLLTVAAVVALVLPPRLLARNAFPELGIALFALLGFALAAGRGTIIQVVTVAAIARWLYRGRPPIRLLLVGIAVVLVFSVGFFYLRTSQHGNDTLGIELREQVYPELPAPLRPLVPVYLPLATNMEALSRLVDYFPAHRAYGWGAYDAHGLDLFVPWAKDVQAVSAVVSPPWVTSTVAGPLWADGGLPLVVAGLAVIGALVCGTWSLAWQRRELRFVLVAANLFFLALFGVYVNLFTYQIDWLLITPLLWAFGAVAEDRSPVPEAIPLRLRARPVRARGAKA